MSKLTLKQARRWYSFGVGRIALDMYDNVYLQTISGKMFYLSDADDRTEARNNIGYIACFWIKKSDERVTTNLAITGLNEKLTESSSDLVWMNNFGYELGLA